MPSLELGPDATAAPASAAEGPSSESHSGRAVRGGAYTLISYVAAWEYKGQGKQPEVHKERLVYEEVHMSTRSYK